MWYQTIARVLVGPKSRRANSLVMAIDRPTGPRRPRCDYFAIEFVKMHDEFIGPMVRVGSAY